MRSPSVAAPAAASPAGSPSPRTRRILNKLENVRRQTAAILRLQRKSLKRKRRAREARPGVAACAA
jgi:hypothetical protein